MPLISYHFTLSIRISNKLYGGHNILEPGEHCHPLRTLMDSPGSRFRMFRRITPTILLRFAVRSLSHASPTFVGWATLNFWVSLFSHTLSPTLPHRVNCPVKLYLVATLPYSLSPMDCEPYKEKPHRSKLRLGQTLSSYQWTQTDHEIPWFEWRAFLGRRIHTGNPWWSMYIDTVLERWKYNVINMNIVLIIIT